MSRTWCRRLAGGALVVAVLWPATWPPGRDGYPLSSFPMFAHGRRDPVQPVSHVLSVADDGRRRPIPPDVVGNGAVMQAAGMITRAIRGGRAGELCARVADRHGGSVEVATDWYDTGAYFRGQTTPVRRTVHARCEGR